MGLRLGVNDLTVVNNAVNRLSVKPNFAYIQINGQNMAGREIKILRFKNDQIINIVYLEDEKSNLFVELLLLKNMTISFNKNKGGTDLSHVIVDDYANPEHAILRECLTEMAEMIKREALKK